MSRRILIRSMLIVVAATVLTASLATAAGPLQFYSVTPCRVVDTRNPNGITGGPVMAGFQVRNFPMRGICGVASTAIAVSLNVTVVQPGSTGYLTLWPSGSAQPTVSTINFTPADSALANGAIVPLATVMSTAEIAVFNGSAGATHVILDVTGYFAP